MKKIKLRFVDEPPKVTIVPNELENKEHRYSYNINGELTDDIKKFCTENNIVAIPDETHGTVTYNADNAQVLKELHDKFFKEYEFNLGKSKEVLSEEDIIAQLKAKHNQPQEQKVEKPKENKFFLKNKNEINFGEVLGLADFIKRSTIIELLSRFLNKDFGEIPDRFKEINLQNIENQEGVVFGVYKGINKFQTELNNQKNQESGQQKNQEQQEESRFKDLFDTIIIVYNYPNDELIALSKYDYNDLGDFELDGLADKTNHIDLLKELLGKTNFDKQIKSIKNTKNLQTKQAINKELGEEGSEGFKKAYEKADISTKGFKMNMVEYGPYLKRLLETGEYKESQIREFIDDFKHGQYGAITPEEEINNDYVIGVYNLSADKADLDKRLKEVDKPYVVGIYQYDIYAKTKEEKYEELLENHAKLANEQQWSIKIDTGKKDVNGEPIYKVVPKTDWTKETLPDSVVKEIKEKLDTVYTDEYLNSQNSNNKGIIIVYNLKDEIIYVYSKYDKEDLKEYPGLEHYGVNLINKVGSFDYEVKLNEFDYKNAPIFYGRDFKKLLKDGTWSESEVRKAIDKLFDANYGRIINGVQGFHDIVVINNNAVKNNAGNLTGIYPANKTHDIYKDLILRYMQDENRIYALSRYDIDAGRAYWLTGAPSEDTIRKEIDPKTLANARDNYANLNNDKNYDELSNTEKEKVDKDIENQLESKRTAKALLNQKDYVNTHINNTIKDLEEKRKKHLDNEVARLEKALKKWTTTSEVFDKIGLFGNIQYDGMSMNNLLKGGNHKLDKDALEELTDFNTTINTSDNKYLDEYLNSFDGTTENFKEFTAKMFEINELFDKPESKLTDEDKTKLAEAKELGISNKTVMNGIMDTLNEITKDISDQGSIKELSTRAHKVEKDLNYENEEGGLKGEAELDEVSKAIITENITNTNFFDLESYKKSKKYQKEIDSLKDKAKEAIKYIDFEHKPPKEVMSQEEFDKKFVKSIDDETGTKEYRDLTSTEKQELIDKYADYLIQKYDKKLENDFKSEDFANDLLKHGYNISASGLNKEGSKEEFIKASKQAEEATKKVEEATKKVEEATKKVKEAKDKKEKAAAQKELKAAEKELKTINEEKSKAESKKEKAKLGGNGSEVINKFNAVINTPDGKDIDLKGFNIDNYSNKGEAANHKQDLTNEELKEAAKYLLEMPNDLGIDPEEFFDAFYIIKANRQTYGDVVMPLIRLINPLLGKPVPKYAELAAAKTNAVNVIKKIIEKNPNIPIKVDGKNIIRARDSKGKPTWIDDELIIDMIESRGTPTTVDKMADLLIELGSPNREYNFTYIKDCIKRNPWLDTRIEK